MLHEATVESGRTEIVRRFQLLMMVLRRQDEKNNIEAMSPWFTYHSACRQQNVVSFNSTPEGCYVGNFRSIKSQVRRVKLRDVQKGVALFCENIKYIKILKHENFDNRFKEDQFKLRENKLLTLADLASLID